MNPTEDLSTGESPQVLQDGDVVRDLIKHENELMNHRLTWFITLQGLLFAALGFAWEKTDAKGLIFVFCGLGIFSSASAATALHGAATAIKQLAKIQTHPKIIIGRVAPWFETMLYPWFAFPVLFASAWAIILWLNWSR
jgi:hypothetical protein